MASSSLVPKPLTEVTWIMPDPHLILSIWVVAEESVEGVYREPEKTDQLVQASKYVGLGL
jgi:hypothetical protein